MAEDKQIDQMIRRLYGHAGMTRSDIYIALNETMNNPPTREYIDASLKNVGRFVNKDARKITYAERKEFIGTINMSETLRVKQAAELRKNYVKNAMMHTSVSPRLFTKEIRTDVANIYLTDET